MVGLIVGNASPHLTALASSVGRVFAASSDKIGEESAGCIVLTIQEEIKGANTHQFNGSDPNSYEQEHVALIRSIRNGEPLNDGRQVTESPMNANFGRMIAYAGRALKWDWAMKSSRLDLTPPAYSLGDLPVAPVAMPGETQIL